MEKEITDIIRQCVIQNNSFESSAKIILELFNNRRRWFFSFTDSGNMDIETKYDCWAINEDDALKQLGSKYPKATYIFITKN